MTHLTVEQITAIGAVLCAIILAWRGEKTSKKVDALHTAIAEAFAPPERVPGAAVPGIGFQQLFRYAALFQTVADGWSRLRGLAPHDAADIPAAKVRVDGKSYIIGPIPVERVS